MVLFLFGQGIERQVAGIRKDPGLCLCEPRTAWRFFVSIARARHPEPKRCDPGTLPVLIFQGESEGLSWV